MSGWTRSLGADAVVQDPRILAHIPRSERMSGWSGCFREFATRKRSSLIFPIANWPIHPLHPLHPLYLKVMANLEWVLMSGWVSGWSGSPATHEYPPSDYPRRAEDEPPTTQPAVCLS